MANGNVKFYNEEKGIGMISTPTGQVIPFNKSELLTPIKVGQDVVFVIESTKKGDYAFKVRCS